MSGHLAKSHHHHRRDPWSSLFEMQRDMSRLFDELKLPWSAEAGAGADFAPLCELEESDSEYVVRVDVPGLKKEDLRIELSGNEVTISGERKSERQESKGKVTRSELSYGSFARSIRFPTAVAEDKLQAELREGVLTLRAPKVEPAGAKAIPIQ